MNDSSILAQHGIAIAVLLAHVMRHNLVSPLPRYRDIAALGERVDPLSLVDILDGAFRPVRAGTP